MDNDEDRDSQQLQRDPDEWATRDEPMTDAQASYLRTLSAEAGDEFHESLTKAQASKRIDELRERSPRLAEGREEGTRTSGGGSASGAGHDSQ